MIKKSNKPIKNELFEDNVKLKKNEKLQPIKEKGVNFLHSYYISSLGNVYHYKNNNLVKLIPFNTRSEKYPNVYLKLSGGGRVRRSILKLITTHYLEKPEGAYRASLKNEEKPLTASNIKWIYKKG